MNKCERCGSGNTAWTEWSDGPHLLCGDCKHASGRDVENPKCPKCGGSGEMITVFDKRGVKRECFADRFTVKSSEAGTTYHVHKDAKGFIPGSEDCPICDVEAGV